MKPPIPNYIAHASEPKGSYFGLIIGGLVVLTIVGLVFWYNSKENDKKAS